MRIEAITPGTPPVGGWLTDEGFVPLARWTIYVLRGEHPLLYVRQDIQDADPDPEDLPDA